MTDAEDILRAIGRLYAAVAAPEQWPTAMEEIAELVRGDHSIVIAQHAADGALPFVASARVDERELARSHEAARSRGPGPVVRMPQGVVVPRSALVGDRDYLASVHYNEVVRPLNGFYALGAQQIGPGGGFVVAVCRPRPAGDFNETDTALLQQVLPHLATALELGGRLRLAEQRSTGLAAVFDRLDTAALLVDGAGRPVIVNARAAALLAGDGLAMDRNGLVAATPASTRTLREAIALVAVGSDAAERRLRLRRPSGRPPLLATLLPVWRLGFGVPGAPSPRVAIFIREPDAPPAIDREALADAYRLTRRESEVAVLLAGGADLAAIAAALGLGLGTARYHLKNAFEKTGARSQSALVALVRGFEAPTR